MAECHYKIVYVPADTSEQLQQWELSSSRERLVESLMDRLKTRFAAQSPDKTAAQLERQRQQLMKNVPAGAVVDDRMLALATSMQMVENIALLSNAPEHAFVGVNMYVDDEGSIKDLPTNLRASDIATCCGKPMQVRGDAFLARIFDDGGDGFDRQDLLVSEVSSTAQWVRDAAAQNRRKQASAKPEQLETLLQLRTGDSASQPQRHPQQHSDQSLPPPPPASPAEQAKAAGNRAFAAGDYQEALRQYSKALEADPQLAAAQNNRALAHLKLRQFDAADADATAVLQAQPRNVKALLRRGDARAALGNHSAAVEDYKLVLEEQPQHREAQSKLAAALPLTHESSCTRR